MYQVEIKALFGDNVEIVIKTAKNEKSAQSIARYWLGKFDRQSVPAMANWTLITDGGAN